MWKKENNWFLHWPVTLVGAFFLFPFMIILLLLFFKIIGSNLICHWRNKRLYRVQTNFFFWTALANHSAAPLVWLPFWKHCHKIIQSLLKALALKAISSFLVAIPNMASVWIKTADRCQCKVKSGGAIPSMSSLESPSNMTQCHPSLNTQQPKHKQKTSPCTQLKARITVAYHVSTLNNRALRIEYCCFTCIRHIYNPKHKLSFKVAPVRGFLEVERCIFDWGIDPLWYLAALFWHRITMYPHWMTKPWELSTTIPTAAALALDTYMIQIIIWVLKLHLWDGSKKANGAFFIWVTDPLCRLILIHSAKSFHGTQALWTVNVGCGALPSWTIPFLPFQIPQQRYATRATKSLPSSCRLDH